MKRSVCLLALLFLEAFCWNTSHRNQSGLKIGQKHSLHASVGGRGTGFKIGQNKSILRNHSIPGKNIAYTVSTTSSTTELPEATTEAVESRSSVRSRKLVVALVVPYKSFFVRLYHKAVSAANTVVMRGSRGTPLNSFKTYELDVRINMKPLTPSPTG